MLQNFTEVDNLSFIVIALLFQKIILYKFKEHKR